MKSVLLSIVITASIAVMPLLGQNRIDKDTISTSAVDLEIHFLRHGTLMFTFDGLVFHLDPWLRIADYTKLTKADIVLISHDHADHLDPKALELVTKDDTDIIYTQVCSRDYPGGDVMD